MRVNCKVVVSLAPSPRNSDSEAVGSVFDMPVGGQIIEREFFFQDIHDGNNVIQQHPDGLSTCLRKIFRQPLRLL